MKNLRTKKPTDQTGEMKMNCKPTFLAAALLASVAISALAQAQQDESEYAPDYIIVKVHPGVAPMPVQGVGMGLRYIAEHNLPPEAVEVAEVLMAVTMQVSDVDVIEPMIRFPITNTDLAAQTGLDRLYTISVPPGTDVAALADQLAFYETHLEFASVAWYGEFAGNHPNDPLLIDQWYMDNTGQPLSLPCPPHPFCACFRKHNRPAHLVQI